MGCDIHLHTEVKINGTWHHYGQPFIKRNYSLFTVIAGVRQEDTKITPGNFHSGLPNDTTLITTIDSQRDNYHDFGWLDAAQIVDLAKWYKLNVHSDDLAYEAHDFEGAFDYLFSNAWSLPNRIVEDIRFVFWFDN